MTNELTTRNTDLALIEPWETLKDQAQIVQKSGLAPKSLNSPEKILTVALKGRELRMPMMQALSQIHVIEGKPTLSGEGMLALVQRAGHRVRIVETTSETCVIEGIRSNDPDHSMRIEWTMEDAKRAKLAGKGAWATYPRAMLRNRAVSELCRAMFADVLSGASHTPEELGAVVDEDGSVVDDMQPEERHDDIEDAEIVEEDETGEVDIETYLEEIARVHNKIPDHSRAPIGKVLDYVDGDVERARRSLAKLKKDYETSLSRGEAAQPFEEQAS